MEQIETDKIVKLREAIMQRILPSEDIRPISLFGSQAIELLRSVQTNRRPVFLIKNGKAAGVLMDIAEYERFVELIELHEVILASEAEADRGEVISHEQLEKESKAWVKQANHRKTRRSIRNRMDENCAAVAKSDRRFHCQRQAFSRREFLPRGHWQSWVA